MIPIDRGGGGCPSDSSNVPFRNLRFFFIALTATLILPASKLAFAAAQRGTLVHEETVRVAPNVSAARVGDAGRGHELIIIETSREWVHVEAVVRDPNPEEGATDEEAEGKAITGWILNKGMVTATTQDGDRIIFGEAADSEDQASRRRGRRDAAQDAMRLYYRVYDLFPTSPLAAEGLYRAADIRGQMDEEWMKLVMKKFPGTKWADLAAFHLIENKLCGDWQAASKCPDKEAEMYEKYAKEHEQSPSAPEALYDAAWRRSALIEIYKTEANQKKAEEAKSRALGLAQKIVTQYAQSDWSSRAQMLIFYVQQGVPTYGNSS